MAGIRMMTCSMPKSSHAFLSSPLVKPRLRARAPVATTPGAIRRYHRPLLQQQLGPPRACSYAFSSARLSPIITHEKSIDSDRSQLGDNSKLTGVRGGNTARTLDYNDKAGSSHRSSDSDSSSNRMDDFIPIKSFDNPHIAFRAFSTGELIRAYVVLRICAVRVIAANCERLLHTAYSLLPTSFIDAIVKRTFFGHFCAGETDNQVGITAKKLKKFGVGGILDYAAEAEEHGSSTNSTSSASASASASAPAAAATATGPPRAALRRDQVVARQWDYENETVCDKRMEQFLRCIEAVRDQTPGGFAAIKVTALGPPALLMRMNNAVVQLQRMFKRMDINAEIIADDAVGGEGKIPVDVFRQGYCKWFKMETDQEKEEYDQLIQKLDSNRTGYVDLLDWTTHVGVTDIGHLTRECRHTGPLKEAALTAEELMLLKAMETRVETLAMAAAQAGVRLMVDAEQTYYQAAIDSLVLGLQSRLNHPGRDAVVFSTYQCYLKGSIERMVTDMRKAQRGNYKWAAKIVRGAYMVSERERAERLGISSPICASLQETHEQFNHAIDITLEKIAKEPGSVELMVATHNKDSVQHAVQRMHELKVPKGPEGGIYFGQLLGMADGLSFPLGAEGFQVFKYLPYGKVGETMPYLLRRAQENSSLMGGEAAVNDRRLIMWEIKRRLFGGTD